MRHALLILPLVILGACRSPDAGTAGAAPEAGARPLFPHVRFDRARRLVEFDAAVSIDCRQPTTPRVYLEVTACTRDSREYESLVVTDARPSDVHAALLLAGLAPGEPGRFVIEGPRVRAVPARGDPVRVSFVYREGDGPQREVSPLDWVIDLGSGTHLAARTAPGAPWVFAGSRIVPFNGHDVYDADGEGTLIGLTTFGAETVAFADTLSPDSAVQEPAWIADISRVPAIGTPVVVRITPAP